MSRQNRHRYFHSLIGIIFTFSLLLNTYFIVNTYRNNTAYTVIDGDTFRLKTGERVRLISINAPAIDDCLGKEAKDLLENLVKGKLVRLEDKTRDTYGRLLASVFVGTTYVNQAIVEKGLARVNSGSSSYDEKLRQAAKHAKEKKLGIYSQKCIRTTPPTTNCAIKGNIDQSSGKKFYHLPYCRHYNEVILNEAFGEKWFCSEKEAQKSGFIKAGGC